MRKKIILLCMVIPMLLLLGCNANNGMPEYSTMPSVIGSPLPTVSSATMPSNAASATQAGMDISVAPNVSGVPNASATPADTESSASLSGGVKDYFPILKNVKYTYEGLGNEYASYTVYNDFTSKDKVQQRIDNGATVVSRVIQISNGSATNIFSRGEAYYRDNFLKRKSNQDDVLIKEPLVKGTTWTLPDKRVRTITDTAVTLSTPTGTYTAIEVTTDGADSQTMDYYVKGVGLVKTVFTDEGTVITSTLSSIENNVPFEQTVRFYYPGTDEKIYYVDKQLSFHTDDITRNVLQEAYKETPGSPAQRVFSQNTKINSLYLNDDGMVYIDLNRAFLTEMNAGSGYEALILQSIANTFGRYYGTDKVILTIDNKLYESGHIALKKGEYLTVDETNAVKLE